MKKSVGIQIVAALALLGLGGSPRLKAQQYDEGARPLPSQQGKAGHELAFAETARAVVDGAYVPNWQVATISADGQDSYLTNHPYGAFSPDWSRDGSRIYYWALTDGPDGIFWIPSGGGASTQVDTGCGANPDCLGDDSPAVSPNGRRLLTERAFLPIDENGNASNASIFSMDIDGSGAAQITFPGAGLEEDHFPRWAPHGHRFVFQRLAYGTGISTMYIANSDGSGARAVTDPGLDIGDPDWSPDGDRIVFQSPAEPDPSTPQQIYTIRPNGTHLVQLTHFPLDPNLTTKSINARWSPDGDRIAFSHVDANTTRGPDNIPHADIFVMSPDGSDLVQVNHTPDAENGAAWRPRR